MATARTRASVGAVLLTPLLSRCATPRNRLTARPHPLDPYIPANASRRRSGLPQVQPSRPSACCELRCRGAPARLRWLRPNSRLRRLRQGQSGLRSALHATRGFCLRIGSCINTVKIQRGREPNPQPHSTSARDSQAHAERRSADQKPRITAPKVTLARVQCLQARLQPLAEASSSTWRGIGL